MVLLFVTPTQLRPAAPLERETKPEWSLPFAADPKLGCCTNVKFL